MNQLNKILNILNFGLSNFHLLDPDNKKFVVKDISILNDDILCCSFFANSRQTIDIKMEMITIMGFFNGFLKDGFEGYSFTHYALRAFDKDDKEILYGISPKSSLEYINDGNSIDWLKSTLFQENTDEYRLSQAKRIISEIENCLREIVKIKLNEKFGIDWWNKSLDNKLGKEVKETYLTQFGAECNDGNTLISYTYTLQLKKIILTHYNLFKPYFESINIFEEKMDMLNKIRREEAHNRVITDTNLKHLTELHEKLAGRVIAELSNFQSVYLTENWRNKIKKIMLEKKYKAIHSKIDMLNEKDPYIKLQKISQNTKHLISHLDEIVIKLESISTPIHKRKQQNDLIEILTKQKSMQTELLEQTTELNESKINDVVTRIENYKIVIDNFVFNLLMDEN